MSFRVLQILNTDLCKLSELEILQSNLQQICVAMELCTKMSSIILQVDKKYIIKL